ncbi:MAG: hypothetical protein GX096_12040 [Clostridiales bacterium]|nr:hypothetical protein [Clostridiales bacterium]
MNKQFQDDVDNLLSGFTWQQKDTESVLSKLEARPPVMKKKLTLSVALAMVLLLTVTVAALAIGLTASKSYTNLQKARNAIMEKYDFTTEMITVLLQKYSPEGDDQRIFEFYGATSMFMKCDAIGEYTVQIDENGKANAAWSHDDVDPATWADGDLNSPVWGAPQLAQALERYWFYRQWETDNSDLYTIPHEERVKRYEELEEQIAPLKCNFDYRKTDEERWAGFTHYPDYTIDEGAEEYAELAKQALLDQYGVTETTLELFDIGTELVDDSWEITVLPLYGSYLDKVTDWRWANDLHDKLGTYTVLIDVNTKEIQSVSWSLDDIDVSQYDETNWGAADAITPQMLVWVMDFITTTKPITDKYPDLNHDCFSLEDAAAYDQKFRDVGFSTNSRYFYPHDLPKEGDITQEQAKQIASEAMMADFFLTAKQIADSYELVAEYIVEDGESTWEVTFYSSEAMGHVTLNAADGMITYVTLDSGASGNG